MQQNQNGISSNLSQLKFFLNWIGSQSLFDFATGKCNGEKKEKNSTCGLMLLCPLNAPEEIYDPLSINLHGFAAGKNWPYKRAGLTILLSLPGLSQFLQVSHFAEHMEAVCQLTVDIPQSFLKNLTYMYSSHFLNSSSTLSFSQAQYYVNTQLQNLIDPYSRVT